MCTTGEENTPKKKHITLRFMRKENWRDEKKEVFKANEWK